MLMCLLVNKILLKNWKNDKKYCVKITNSWTVPQTVDGPEALKHFEMI